MNDALKSLLPSQGVGSSVCGAQRMPCTDYGPKDVITISLVSEWMLI